MVDEPMSDERLAEIRASVHNINERGRYSGAVSPSEVIYASDASDLLAEVDRLRGAIDTARQLIERLEEHAELPIAHPLNTAINDWLRSIDV